MHAQRYRCSGIDPYNLQRLDIRRAGIITGKNFVQALTGGRADPRVRQSTALICRFLEYVSVS